MRVFNFQLDISSVIELDLILHAQNFYRSGGSKIDSICMQFDPMSREMIVGLREIVEDYNCEEIS